MPSPPPADPNLPSAEPDAADPAPTNAAPTNAAPIADDGKAFDYFGDRVSWLDRLRMRASLRVRRQMYEWMRDRLGGVAGKVVLDHGSTPDTEHLDSNCFIKWLIEDGATVYATSPEPIDHLETVFPGLRAIAFPPTPDRLPVPAPEFDCVLSSATIEHVGGEASQVQYCRDLLAIAPRLCLTTPNRYHWLDFHTKIPIVHWLPRRWHRRILRAIGLTFWSFEANLRLLSKTDLDRILRRSAEPTFVPRCPPRSEGGDRGVATGSELGAGRDAGPDSGSDPLTVEWCEPKFLGCVSNLAVFVQRGPR